MEQRIKSLVADNLKRNLSKDQIMQILRDEEIPVKQYNDFILKTLSSASNPLAAKPSKTARVDSFLDEEFLKNLLKFKRKDDKGENKILFEDKSVPTKCYSEKKYISCRTMNRMLTVDEISAKFKEYAEELGLSRSIKRECAEYLGKGLELYIKNLVSECKGKITIPNLKRGLGKHLSLFNNLNMP